MIKIEAVTVPPPVAEETMEEEVLEEEHLLYDSNDDQTATVDEQATKGNAIVSFDSDGQDATPKYVYSWKDLCKPKVPKKRAPKVRKISEYRPKPDFIPHTCYICNTSYPDADGLETHLEQHVSLLPYRCDQCSTEVVAQEFKTLITLNRHMQTHSYPYPCDFCPIKLLTMLSYEDHMRRFHDEQLETDGHTCDYCGKYFLDRRQFRIHHAKHRALEEGRYKCEFCSKAFSNGALLKRHRRIHTGEMPFECKKCGKKFNHEDNFNTHKRHHINEKGYVCTDCGKSFINSTYLRYHMAEHFPDDPKYRAQPSTTKHTRYNSPSADRGKTKFQTDGNGKKFFECKVEGCNFVTTVYGNFFYHRSMHEKKYQCELCPKRFHMNCALQKHIAFSHEGKRLEKTLACQYCGKLFNCKQKLSAHIDIHENNRRHKCQFCEKSFVQKANLTAHERIHTGERPFLCRACPAAFITSSGRTKHEKTHPHLQSEQEGGDKQESDNEYEELDEEMEVAPAEEELVEYVAM